MYLRVVNQDPGTKNQSSFVRVLCMGHLISPTTLLHCYIPFHLHLSHSVHIYILSNYKRSSSYLILNSFSVISNYLVAFGFWGFESLSRLPLYCNQFVWLKKLIKKLKRFYNYHYYFNVKLQNRTKFGKRISLLFRP